MMRMLIVCTVGVVMLGCTSNVYVVEHRLPVSYSELRGKRDINRDSVFRVASQEAMIEAFKRVKTN